jgi:hypothetical protein
MWQYVRLRGDAAHHLLGARSGAHGCGMMKQPHTRGVRMPLIGGGGGKPPVVTYCDREYQLHAWDTRVAAVVQTTGAMWAWGCVDVLVHHTCTPLVDMPRMYITRRVCHTCTCTARGHLGMGTWTSLVYVVITRVSGHGSSRVFTTRRVCHTSTCTARGHPSMCTWTALAYVVTAHHACSPLVGYAIRVHVRHVDTRVRVHHWHMEYTLYMEMCRCGFA